MPGTVVLDNSMPTTRLSSLADRDISMLHRIQPCFMKTMPVRDTPISSVRR